jgi:DNA-binding transcriptional regulator YiaG
MYRYTDSGLDNVFLVNGYYEKDTPYGRAVSIEDLDGLHKAIGRWLVNVAKPLNGAEFRFLRHELDLSQKKLGQMMGKSEQAIGRWERAPTKAVDPIADRLIRIIYTEWIDGNDPIKELIERLCDQDQLEQTECRLEERDGRWRVADEAMAA